MWLLNTEDGTFHRVDRPREHRYAILSHVWQTSGEQTFQDLITLQHEATKMRSRASLKRCLTFLKPSPPLSCLSGASPKIRECCALARKHGYRWVWIDSCCIDKTSSTELSEAINSMYEWYAAADICFAFLEDVSDDHDPRLKDSKFRRSRWFTRGWTLQELIAPATVLFLSKEWRPLGTKASLADLVEEITGIGEDVLTHRTLLDSVSVARRMSWAAKRQTTREEDKAYSLMGIFGVNMPTIYGEGGNAFIRLQEEILKQVPDQSIFAWGPLLRDDTLLYRNMGPYTVSDDSRYWQSRNLFAWSPDAFVNSAGISSIAPETFEKRAGIPFVLSEYTISSYGMRSRMPLIPLRHGSEKTTYLVLLACEDIEDRLVAVLLYPQPRAVGRYYVGHYVGRPQVPPYSYFRLVALSKPSLERLRGAIEVSDVCIPYRPAPMVKRTEPSVPCSPTFQCPCVVVIPTWVIGSLANAGFYASVSGVDNTLEISEFTPPETIALVVKARNGGSLQVRMGRCQCLGRFFCMSVTGTHSRTVESTSACSSVIGDICGVRLRCPEDHVAAWPKPYKDFACGVNRIRMTFTPWVGRMGVYSLTIDVLELDIKSESFSSG
ncbi:HET-domain-containing protein [Cubamyces sp. BRFM 1775]|nr:HET-domain-containing protein [Cubamyces sp. BRFM 1775]